jgi:tetratricopeptide (TPR) repeat protein
MFGFLFGKKGTSESMEVDAAPDVVKLYNQGNIAKSKKQFEKAIQLYTLAIEKDPTFVGAYINRGNTYSQWQPPTTNMQILNGLLDKAITDYSKALELEPLNALVFGNRALTKYIKGDFNEAFSDLQEAKRLGYQDFSPEMEQNIIRRAAQKK